MSGLLFDRDGRLYLSGSDWAGQLKEAGSAWRSVANLGKMIKTVPSIASRTRLGTLRNAAKYMGKTTLPGAGARKAIEKLPTVTQKWPITQPAKHVYRGVKKPRELLGGGRLNRKPWAHASPSIQVASEYSRPSLLHPVTDVSAPRLLLGQYRTSPGQKYTVPGGIEAGKRVYSYRMARLMDLMRRLFGRPVHNLYETPVRAENLSNIILHGRVLPRTPMGRELLRTSTQAPGTQLPAQIRNVLGGG